jgi:hypothetical protein
MLLLWFPTIFLLFSYYFLPIARQLFKHSERPDKV